MKLIDYVDEGIHELFVEVAELVNQGFSDLDAEETAGIPLMLFKAEMALRQAWREFVEREEARSHA